jgi:Mg2+ and Co2+ transporter CorA
MATAPSSITAELEKLTECPICAETYDDPRTLPCLRTYCLKCVEKCANAGKPGAKMACPVCRTEFVVPDGGVGSLRKNFFMEKMKRLRELSVSTDLCAKACDPCSHTDKKTSGKLATMYCVDCQEKMCDVCSGCHSGMMVSRNHKQVTFGDHASFIRELQSSYPPATCDKHPDKVLDVYCLNCQNVLCTMCFTQHQGHVLVAVGEVADEFRCKMSADVSSLSGVIENYRKMVEEINKEKESFIENVEHTENAICTRAEQLKALVDRDKMIVLDELSLKKKERVKLIENTVHEVEQQVAIVDSLRKYINELDKRGNASEIARDQSALHNRAEELLKPNSVISPVKQITTIRIAFTASLTQNEKTSNMVGKITSTRGGYLEICFHDCAIEFNFDAAAA